MMLPGGISSAAGCLGGRGKGGGTRTRKNAVITTSINSAKRRGSGADARPLPRSRTVPGQIRKGIGLRTWASPPSEINGKAVLCDVKQH